MKSDNNSNNNNNNSNGKYHFKHRLFTFLTQIITTTITTTTSTSMIRISMFKVWAWQIWEEKTPFTLWKISNVSLENLDSKQLPPQIHTQT